MFFATTCEANKHCGFPATCLKRKWWNGWNLPTPATMSFGSFLLEPGSNYPYFVKPREIHLRGTPDQWYMKLHDRADLEYARRKLAGREEDFVIQEFLDGLEVNIDFFCDQNGQVRSIVPLKRLSMGTSRGITRGEILQDNRFDTYVEKIASACRFWGPNQIQAFVTADGKVTFTEINGRFSGSMILFKEAGVNFFAYFIKLIQGRPVEIAERQRPLKMTCWEHPVFYKEQPVIDLGSAGKKLPENDALLVKSIPTGR